jgi:PadR family transcriptional regulator, regulatory protein PadR
MFRKPKGQAGDKLGIPQGTLYLLILTIVRREPLHGYGIAQRLQLLTDGVFQINPGSLFPALYALERDGLLRCEERASENNRRARYYEPTARGRKRLEQEEQRWARVTGAIANVLKSA